VKLFPIFFLFEKICGGIHRDVYNIVDVLGLWRFCCFFLGLGKNKMCYRTHRAVLFFALSFLLLAFSRFAVADSDIKNNSIWQNKKYALLIIDMQHRFIVRAGGHELQTNREKVSKLIDMQIALIEVAKQAQIPIVIIEFPGAGDTDKRLLGQLEGYDKLKFFEKNDGGVFSVRNWTREEIIKYFAQQDVGNLIITGANGSACIKESIEGAMAIGYNIVAFSKGIADFNSKEFIYPYEDIYNFAPCDKCTFQEIDELETISLLLAKSGDVGNIVGDRDNDGQIGNGDSGSKSEDIINNALAR